MEWSMNFVILLAAQRLVARFILLYFDLKFLQVHFLRQGPKLIIRLRDGNSATSEFVNPSLFTGDIPRSILDDAVILYHDVDGRVEFLSSRPMGWTSNSLPDWVLDTKNTLHCNRFVGSQSQLGDQILSPHSPLVAALFTQLNSLEVSQDELLVLWSTRVYSDLHHRDYSGRHLLVDLPRYKLSFYADDSNRLASRQFPRYSVASSQALGTLVGLQSKLILDSPGQHRCVVIPVIPNSIATSWNPMQIAPVVTIRPSKSTKHIRTSVFEIDQLVLQRILPKDSTLSSWLYLALLHVVTSSPLADTLTAESGVQRAFRMLSNAQSISFKELEETSSSILELISKCSPIRRFYPEHLQVMETIAWNHGRLILPPFILDDRWETVVRRIFDHDINLATFRSKPSSPKLGFLNQSNRKLINRAAHGCCRLIPVDETSGMPNYAFS
jgi:hypothetical protein